MKPFEEELNRVIVDTYRSILRVEETILKQTDRVDLTIGELHMLESVGKGKDRRRTISEIAEDLGITLPSVTVAINKLMKKGYVEKIQSTTDRGGGCQNRLCLADKDGTKDGLCSPIFPRADGAQHRQRDERGGTADSLSRCDEAGRISEGADQGIRKLPEQESKK